VSGYSGWTALLESSHVGHVDVVRVLLAAGADKHHVSSDGSTATSEAGDGGKPGSRAAILALFAAAP